MHLWEILTLMFPWIIFAFEVLYENYKLDPKLWTSQPWARSRIWREIAHNLQNWPRESVRILIHTNSSHELSVLESQSVGILARTHAFTQSALQHFDFIDSNLEEEEEPKEQVNQQRKYIKVVQLEHLKSQNWRSVAALGHVGHVFNFTTLRSHNGEESGDVCDTRGGDILRPERRNVVLKQLLQLHSDTTFQDPFSESILIYVFRIRSFLFKLDNSNASATKVPAPGILPPNSNPDIFVRVWFWKKVGRL